MLMQHGDTLLMIASQFGQTNVVKLLVKNGASLNDKNKVYLELSHIYLIYRMEILPSSNHVRKDMLM